MGKSKCAINEYKFVLPIKDFDYLKNGIERIGELVDFGTVPGQDNRVKYAIYHIDNSTLYLKQNSWPLLHQGKRDWVGSIDIKVYGKLCSKMEQMIENVKEKDMLPQMIKERGKTWEV